MDRPSQLPHEPQTSTLDVVKAVNHALGGNVTKLIFEPLSGEPTEKTVGTVCLADGSNWNPGKGAGVYKWDGSAWVMLDTPPGLYTNSWGGIRSKTPYGYIDLGPANSSYGHIYTDMPSFYFNKPLYINGYGVITTTRSILTGTGLTGGGDLSADRTIALTGQALAVHNLASNGLITRTGAGTVVARTLLGTVNQITVTNGDGVAGNPSLSLPQDIHTGAAPTFDDLTLTGILRVGTSVGGGNFPGDIVARRTASTGAYYFGESNTNYLYFDGTNYSFGTGGVTISSGALGIGAAPIANTLLYLYAGATRKQVVIASDGDTSAFSDLAFKTITTSGFSTGLVHTWDLSHRKDGYFSGSEANTGTSLELYGFKIGGGYYAPMCLASNGNLILASSRNATPVNVGIRTITPAYPLDINGDTRISGQLYSSGAVSTYCALSVNGSKNGYSGINFRSGGANLGSLLCNATYQGYLNSDDTAWSWYWGNGVLSGGTVPVARLTGVMPVTNGGTGTSTLTGYIKGNATSAFTATTTIPAADISGVVTAASRVDSLGLYVWNAATTAFNLPVGITTSFVQAANGWSSFGTVINARGYLTAGGGALQLYVPYSPTYGGSALKYRTSDYDADTADPPWTAWKTLIDSNNIGLQSVANADTVDNFHANTAYNDFTGNRIPVRHSSGYLFSNYFNMSANVKTTSPQYLVGEWDSDNYLRYVAPANVTVGNATNADTVDGFHASAFAPVLHSNFVYRSSAVTNFDGGLTNAAYFTLVKNAWTDLDISALVPVTATAVLLTVYVIKSGVPVSGESIRFHYYGQTDMRSSDVQALVANLPTRADVIVPTYVSGSSVYIRYFIHTNIAYAGFTIVGWWI